MPHTPSSSRGGRRDFAHSNPALPIRFFAVFSALVMALVMVLTLTACSGTEGNGQDTNAMSKKDENAVVETRSIQHALGTAEITGIPKRVVTLGQGSAETALALGVVPVAMEAYEWGADESGYLPWINEDLKKKGVDNKDKPALIPGADQLSVEKVASFEPDLILAPWSGITQEQYDQLSKIAPTVAYDKEPWVITWEQQINTVALALGQGTRAKQLIDTINKQFADAKEESYAKHTFSFIYNSGVGNYGIFLPTEQRVQFVSKLGLKVDPVVEQFRESVVAGTDSATVSAENLDKLNASDLIFTFYSDEKSRTELHDDPAYSRISAIAKGAEVAPKDQSFVTGSSMINPLSVPWAISRYKELIDKALEEIA